MPSPSTRWTTTPSVAVAASSPARPVASLARSTLISSASARSSSSLRCTPPTRSSGGGADEPRRVGERPLVALQERDAGLTGDRLDAPQVRADRALADDLDRADVAGRPHVRAAAELDRRAGLEDAHDVAVLVAEEGDRAQLLGLGLRRLEGPHRRVGQRLGVGQALDLLDLLGRDRLVVGEVEAQPVGRDERPGLLDVVAEHLAQRVVQQVGGGVVAPGRVAAGDVDRRRRHLARA